MLKDIERINLTGRTVKDDKNTRSKQLGMGSNYPQKMAVVRHLGCKLPLNPNEEDVYQRRDFLHQRPQVFRVS